MPEKLMTIGEVALMLHVSQRTVKSLIAAKRIAPVLRLNARVVRIPTSAVERILRESKG